MCAGLGRRDFFPLSDETGLFEFSARLPALEFESELSVLSNTDFPADVFKRLEFAVEGGVSDRCAAEIGDFADGTASRVEAVERAGVEVWWCPLEWAGQGLSEWL